ncbi:MAG: MarR family winged helix-turn-helix transcriptional regulator [Hyphomicrobiales bacterium]|nr:MarR family winged helix-turn-helix transcriptional regulator [Hyphomicrobiales bacterium]
MPERSVSIATKPPPDDDRIAPVRSVLSEEEGIDFTVIELLFFAYRDFTSDPDQILAQYGFGRAHHRVVHFVNRRPGLTVAELLDVLKITKQSLARVLKQLIDTGHIVQVQGPRDRRQRELYPTAKGRALSLALAAPQSRRIARALEGSDFADRAAVERFLKNMVDPELRAQIGKTPRTDAGAGGANGDGVEENRGEG